MGHGKHRDTGRQRSGPEEGKHPRQPEGRAGRRAGQPQARLAGGADNHGANWQFGHMRLRLTILYSAECGGAVLCR